MNIKENMYFISGERFTIVTNNKYHTINLSKKFNDHDKSECIVANMDNLSDKIDTVLHTKNIRARSYTVSESTIKNIVSTGSGYVIIKNKNIIRNIVMRISDNS